MAELRSDKEMEKRMQYGCIALLLLRAEKIDRIFYVLYTDRNFVDNFLKVVIYLALVANI